jgi:hypothetical protein
MDRNLSVSNTCNTEVNDVGFAHVLNTKLNELAGGKKPFRLLRHSYETYTLDCTNAICGYESMFY